MAPILQKMKPNSVLASAKRKAWGLVFSNSVIVFSNSGCPYCVKVKELFSQMGANFKAIDLDQESDGHQLHIALAQWTKQQTFPNVFIGGKHFGYAATMALHEEGKLAPLLTKVGAVAISSA